MGISEISHKSVSGTPCDLRNASHTFFEGPVALVRTNQGKIKQKTVYSFAVVVEHRVPQENFGAISKW